MKKYLFIFLIICTSLVSAGGNKLFYLSQALKQFEQSYKHSRVHFEITDDEIYVGVTKVSNSLSLDWSRGDKLLLLSELEKLWKNKFEFKSESEKIALSHPRFKVEMAYFLGEGIKQCKTTLKNTALRNFVLSQMHSDNLRTRISAIRALGMVGTVKDIPQLATIVESELPGWSEHAAQALDLLHEKSAIVKLRELSPRIKDLKIKEFIDKILAQYINGINLLGTPCT